MNVFELCATLKLDKSDYENSLNSAEDSANAIGPKIGAALATVAKIGAAALAAGAAGVVALTKSAVDNYGEYEQLVGGVQKLYGNMGQSVEEYAKANNQSVSEVKSKWQELEDAQNTVLKNAQAAYATAGMSANEYMDTATSFSAALISSLDGDTQKAAELTDVAMRAISDNYNTFGGDMENVTNAFKGFSKQNYTMLDNLKLGYGGTKTEMERLIADANEYAKANGQAADLSIDSFADIVTAIELVQEKQNIAGTTAREASSTIQGALGMTKSAWDNLVTGLGDSEADITQLIDNLVSSATTAFGNILPVAMQALEGIGQLVQQAAPIIAAELPGLVNTLIPSVVAAAAQLVMAIVSALPALIQTLITSIPIVIQAIVGVDWSVYGGEIMTAFANGLTSALGPLIEAGALGADEYTGTILTKVMTFVEELKARLSEWFETIQELIAVFAEFAQVLWDTFGQTILEYTSVVWNAIWTVIDAVLQIIKGTVSTWTALMQGDWKGAWTAIKDILNGLLNIMKSLVTVFLSAIKAAIEAVLIIIKSVWSTAWNFVKDTLSAVWENIKQTVTQLKDGITEKITGVRTVIVEQIGAAMDYIKNLPAQALQWGEDLISNFIEGIKEMAGELIDTVKDIASDIADYIGFSEPKKGPLSNFHTYAPDMMDLFMQGIEDNKAALQDTVANAFDFGTVGSLGDADFGASGSVVSGASRTIYIENVMTLDGKVISTEVNRVLGAAI